MSTYGTPASTTDSDTFWAKLVSLGPNTKETPSLSKKQAKTVPSLLAHAILRWSPTLILGLANVMISHSFGQSQQTDVGHDQLAVGMIDGLQKGCQQVRVVDVKDGPCPLKYYCDTNLKTHQF